MKFIVRAGLEFTLQQVFIQLLGTDLLRGFPTPWVSRSADKLVRLSHSSVDFFSKEIIIIIIVIIIYSELILSTDFYETRYFVVHFSSECLLKNLGPETYKYRSLML